ncbi:hypothetical protein M5689_021718 [Euphorbia peplus]|nr:hypothetical protein M5689_021718 [Euphorbia peplus]
MLSSCTRSIFSSSSRVCCVLKFLNPRVRLRSTNYYQGNCSYYSFSFNNKMTGPKVRINAVDRNKKQRTVTQTWRPVSTVANSAEDVTVESEDGVQLNEIHCSASSSTSNAEEQVSVVEEVTKSTVISSNMDCKVEARTQEVDSVGKHSLTVEVGTSLIRFIKGKGGSTQQKFEEEMGVKVIFPSSKDSISIEGDSVATITRAREKIQEIIDEAVKSPNLDYSHFISLPLAVYPELVDKLLNFQNSIIVNGNSFLDEIPETDSSDGTDNEDKAQEMRKGCDVAVKLNVGDDRHVKVDLSSVPLVSYAPKASKSTSSKSLSELGIDRSIFIKPKTFHLTVLMLKLWNKERVLAASEVLKSISSKVRDALENRPVYVRLKGLETMRGSMAKARVLYAAVEEIGSEDRLLRACQIITEAFAEAGLVLDKDAKQKLKLHATVMNARHRKGKQRRKYDFDARSIYRQFGSEEWGEYLIREAHLSQRFVFDEHGYYHCCASLPFPEEIKAD